jgi:hypothetical protein
LPFPVNVHLGSDCMGQSEVKRAPADSKGIHPTIKRSPHEIHRADRQPS